MNASRRRFLNCSLESRNLSHMAALFHQGPHRLRRRRHQLLRLRRQRPHQPARSLRPGLVRILRLGRPGRQLLRGRCRHCHHGCHRLAPRQGGPLRPGQPLQWRLPLRRPCCHGGRVRLWRCCPGKRRRQVRCQASRKGGRQCSKQCPSRRITKGTSPTGREVWSRWIS